MDKLFIRGYCDRAAAEQGKDGDPIRFRISNEGVKRDGKNLRAEDWSFDNYRNNPVVLWVHDYSGRNLPIGRADVLAQGKDTLADITFDQADEFARAVERKYRTGFLHAVSVGWGDVRQNGRVVHDLQDISAVPVPADPQALKMDEARALQALAEELSMNSRTSEVDAWTGIASAMLALYRQPSAHDEVTRKKLYVALERAYHQLDKEPPEYRTAQELAGLGLAEIDGLFLEDEVRAGAVLSSRNRTDLEQAVSLIQGVVDRAKKEESDAAPPVKTEGAPAGEARADEDADYGAWLTALNQIPLK